MKNKKQVIRVGDEVRVLYDIRDSYGEVYISKGSIDTVLDFRQDQKGFEYGISYGFYVGTDALELVKSHDIVCELGRDSHQGGRPFVATIWNEKGCQLAEVTDKKFAKKLIEALNLEVQNPLKIKL